MSFWSCLFFKLDLYSDKKRHVLLEVQVKKLSKWFKKFKRYTVSYKKGAYHLHNLFNSPQTMIQSFDSTSFGFYDKQKKMLVSDTIFLKSLMHHCNPEYEFWVMISNLRFKKNVMMENLYDRDLPIEYHFINLHIKEKNLAGKSLINGLVLTDRVWSVFKAGHAITEYHFKESNEKNITLFFTSRWLQTYKAVNADFINSKLHDFFESKNTYLILEDDNKEYNRIYDEMMDLVAENEAGKSTAKIAAMAYHLIERLIQKSNEVLLSEEHFKLDDKDRKNIQRAEQFLNNNVLGEFPGIEKTAQKIGISPTKLKADFKSIHTTSVYKYFSSLQMEAAYQLLMNNQYSVKEVAAMLGYENPSKFSSVFKKKFNLSPSQLNMNINTQ